LHFQPHLTCILKGDHTIFASYKALILLAATFSGYLEIVTVWLIFCVGYLFLGVTANHPVDSAKPKQSFSGFVPSRWFGTWPYSNYLWQQIFYKLFCALPGKALTGFVLSSVIGACSFYFSLNPVCKYINQRWSPAPHYRQTGKPA